MIVVGIDPGSIKLGYGIIRVAARGRGTDLDYLGCGLISAPPGWPAWQRFVELGRDLQNVTREVEGLRQEGEGVACAIEAGFIRLQQGALISSAARGIAQFILGTAFGEVRSYSPQTIKLAATGHGNATKEHVSQIVCLRLGLKIAPGPDETDGLATAICRAFDPQGQLTLAVRAGTMR